MLEERPVTDFGAAPDASAETNGAAFAAAAAWLGPGRRLTIPPGTYELDRTVTL